jgi:outer membrane immunogenic protein
MAVVGRMAGCVIAACGVMLLGSGVASAQTRSQGWKGAYVGGFVGGGMQADGSSEMVRFDTNLDGAFTDVVRTAAGADAFSPGFCGAAAANPLPASGCSGDDRKVEFGGRGGYDGQAGRFVFGGLVDVSRSEIRDSVTAFSTTPAFYTFTRELDVLVGMRGRAGVDAGPVLIYGTGGAAWGSVDQIFTTSNRVNTFVPVNQTGEGTRESVWGYQAGGGAEVRLHSTLSLVGEYVFTSLDNRETSIIRSQGPAPATNPFILVNAAGTNFQRTDRLDVHSLRASLNFRF